MTPEEEKAATVRKCASAVETALREVLARELGGLPFYIVLKCDCPPGFASDNFAGCTCAAMGTLLRPAIGARWVGNGPAILLDDQYVCEVAERCEDVEAIVNGIAAHEAAHVLEDLIDGFFDANSGGPPPAELARLRRELSEGSESDCGHEMPFGHHDDDFVRAAVHVAHRLRRRRLCCPMMHVIDVQMYGLAISTCGLAAALEEECRAAQGRSLLRILPRPPPAEYARLWERERAELQSLLPTIRRMTMFQFLEKLRASREKHQTSAVGKFKKLALQIADGREPKVDDTLEVLRDAGKSIEDLHAAAELVVRRRKLFADTQTAASARERSLEIDRLFEAAAAKLEAAETEHEESVAPLRVELVEIDRRVKAGEAAAKELKATATDANLLARVQTTRMQITEVRLKIERANSRIKELRPRLVSAEVKRASAASDFHDTNRVEWDAEVTRLKAQIAERQEETQRLAGELPELEREHAAALEELICPEAI